MKNLAQIHQFYITICNSGLDRKQKIQQLKALISANELWNIVGVTPAALLVFSDSGYKNISGSGIQRAHIKGRSKLYSKLVDGEVRSSDQLLALIAEYGSCVFALRKENAAIAKGLYFIPAETGDMFPTATVGWGRHTIQEREFLRDLDVQN